MEELEKRIVEVVEEELKNTPDLFLVDVKIKGHVGNQRILVFVDGDSGINIDQCSQLSRAVGNVLEEEDIMPDKYYLEVSSPGLDHPIKMKRQYNRHKGRKLEVELVNGERVKGQLLTISEEAITLKAKGNDRVMKFNEINQSKIEVSFK